MANFRIPLDYKEHVNRAVHNLDCIKRTTLHPMTAVPLYCRRMFRGDKFYFSTPQLLLQSQPTFAPVMGTYRLRIEWYFDSDANRYGWIDNNRRQSVEEVMKNAHHRMQPHLPSPPAGVIADSSDPGHGIAHDQDVYYANGVWQDHSVGRGGIADYMGVAPGYVAPEIRTSYGNVWNLDFILTYLNIIRSYHANLQFSSIPYISVSSQYESGSGTELDWTLDFEEYSLKDLDNLFMLLRYCDNGELFNANVSPITAPSWVPEKYVDAYNKFIRYLQCVTRTCGGLFCTQYEPDLYRNLLSNDMDLLKSEVTTNADGSFTIETFRFKNRLQQIYDRIASVGGRPSDVARSRWGVVSRRGYDIPQLINVQSEYIDTSLVTSNNNGESIDGSNVPGDMAGNVNQRKYPKGTQAFTANEPGMLMAIVTVTPLVDYCQNIERYLLENNFEDEFSPQMAQKGFESVPLSDYSVLPDLDVTDDYDNTGIVAQGMTCPDLSMSVGKQVAWLREMTATNRVHGEFATRGMYETWVLKRQYTTLRSKSFSTDTGFSEVYPDFSGVGITATRSISPYGNPLEWQYPFVAQKVTDPNFFLQASFKVRAVRPIGRRYMPTLE